MEFLNFTMLVREEVEKRTGAIIDICTYTKKTIRKIYCKTFLSLSYLILWFLLR